MPNRIAQSRGLSHAGHGQRQAPNSSESEVKKGAAAGGSVKKLVRSLSDRYSAVTSPLTCKKKTSCSSRTPSLKTMKTTAATSLLPLKPAFSASSKLATQTVTTSSSRKGSLTSTIDLSHKRTPSMAISKRLFHMKAIACTIDSTVSIPHTHVIKRPLQGESKKLTLKAPSSARPSLHLVNLSARDSSAAKQLTEMALHKTLFVESGASRDADTHDCKDRTKLKWQQLEALLKLKDEELEGIQTAGLMLKELCMKQDEEIKALKAAFPATLKEMSQLREACEKQEKELAYSRVALPALQVQVATLMDQLKSLTEDLAQMKACQETSSEKVSSHFHEREASNSSSSTLSVEPSPITNGFLEHLRQSRSGLNNATPCEDQRLTPVRVCEASSSNCPSVTSSDRSSEMPSESKLVNAKHRRVFSAVLSVEQMLKGSGRSSGRRLVTDKEIVDTLQELDKAADKEQALLQERCANAVKELRSSSSRFASLEPIRSILFCASPQLFEDAPKIKEMNQSPKLSKVGANLWNLKPT
eukprot:c24016_g1_i1 orf=234-1820(+)